MRITMLYRPNSMRAGMAEDYAGEYLRLHPERPITLLSIDSLDGDNKAKLYGITSDPAIITTSENGSLLQMWQGETLPPFSELDFYAIGS